MTGARFRDDFSTATLGMGDQLSPEVIFGAAIACAVVLALLRKLFWTRRPEETHFKCSRCGTVSPHSERTIEA